MRESADSIEAKLKDHSMNTYPNQRIHILIK
jgi:hypothetical protein